MGAALLGIGLGLAVTRRAGLPLRRLVETLGAGLQAMPPVVVVALAFPVLGFGIAPTALALVAYAVLPILRATVDGLDTVPSDLREAARAMGLTPLQRLVEVDLPLAAPVVAGALRTAAMLAVATAAVGALACEVAGADGTLHEFEDGVLWRLGRALGLDEAALAEAKAAALRAAP
jgi:osmoprotectant transport system permease protein